MKSFYTKFVIFSMFLIASCSTIEEKHGAELRPASVDKINATSTKNDVRKALGSPSTTSSFGDDTWYYISNQTERRIFSENKMMDQNVLAIGFDTAGIIDNVELYGIENGRKFDFAERTTPTSGHDLTVIEQLLGNVGKFGSDSLTGATGRR